jgi:hypothetical protein
MKVFGHIQQHHVAEGLVELSDISLQAAPEELRRVASFLLQAAQELEKEGKSFGHSHLQDAQREWFAANSCPDVIVVGEA